MDWLFQGLGLQGNSSSEVRGGNKNSDHRPPNQSEGWENERARPDSATEWFAHEPQAQPQDDDGWFGEKKLWRELIDTPRERERENVLAHRQNERPESITGTGLTTWMAEAVCCMQHSSVRSRARERTIEEPNTHAIRVQPRPLHLASTPRTPTAKQHGVGIVFRSEDQGLVVAGLVEGSPASENRAIVPGMVLVGINEVNVLDLEPSEIGKVILGPPGSPVQLRFKDPATDRVHLISTRRQFSIPEEPPIEVKEAMYSDDARTYDGAVSKRSHSPEQYPPPSRSPEQYSPTARRGGESDRRRQKDRDRDRDRDYERRDDRDYYKRGYYDKRDRRDRDRDHYTRDCHRRDADRSYEPPPAFNPAARPARRNGSRASSHASRTPSPVEVRSRDGSFESSLAYQPRQFTGTSSAPSAFHPASTGQRVPGGRRELAAIPSLRGDQNGAAPSSAVNAALADHQQHVSNPTSPRGEGGGEGRWDYPPPASPQAADHLAGQTSQSKESKTYEQLLAELRDSAN